MPTKTKTERRPGLDQLVEIREAVRIKEVRLNEVQGAPITQAEAQHRLSRAVEKATEAIKGKYFQQLSFLHPAGNDTDITSLLSRLDPWELMIWLDGEQLKDQLRLVVDEHFERHRESNGSGLSAAERSAEIESLQAELHSLYEKEEAVFNELREAGLEPVRRGPEDPKIVYDVVEE